MDYRARDPRLNRHVAIKVLHASVAGDPERLQRFTAEAQAVAALNHPNVLTVYEVGAHEDVRTVRSECLDWLLIVNSRHSSACSRCSLIMTTLIGLTAAWTWRRVLSGHIGNSSFRGHVTLSNGFSIGSSRRISSPK